MAFTQTEENQWHIIYEPESFTPLLQLQHATDAPISEQDKVLAEVMGSLQSTLNYLPAHEAYELARTVRERTVAQLKANEQWQTPELPEECYFYHCNHLGLPEALTNQNGEAVWAASYDAWGTIKEEHNPDNLHQPIRLPGQYHDKETDLYYNRHRYYDPKLGNYINQDPIGLASGEPNLTVYPRNPIQGMDPLGLRCEDPKQSVSEPMSPGEETFLSTVSNFMQTIFTRVTGAVTVAGEGTASGGIAIGVGALGHYRQAFRAHKNDLIYQAGGIGKENINNCIDKLLPIWDEIPGSDVECAMRQIGPVCGGLL